MFLQYAYVHKRVCVCVWMCALSGGLSPSIVHTVVLHVRRSSVSHHWPSSTINQESPLCLTKSQWAASITEPALPTHEYSPNETISYRNTGLEVRKKKWKKLYGDRKVCTLSVSQICTVTMRSPQWREKRENLKERKDHMRTLNNVLLFFSFPCKLTPLTKGH